MISEPDAFNELCSYTLSYGDPAFIHQHVVDAFAVQRSDRQTKPIKVTFGLVGLYLHLEKQFTGRQVQLAHMRMARQKHAWPVFELPEARGAITVIETLAVPAGPARDQAIDLWCASVWQAFGANHHLVADLLRRHEII